MAEAVKRMVPGGVTVRGSKPEEPAEGDMYVEDDGRTMVYVGGVWKTLIISPPVTAPSSPTGRMPTPLGFAWPHDPETKGLDWWSDLAGKDETVSVGEDAVEPRGLEELLEVLLCEDCGMELSAVACGPKHAFMADNPETHRLLKPLVRRSVARMRWVEGKTCTVCSDPAPGGEKVAIGTGDCQHVEVRGDQVMMSKAAWAEICDEAAHWRGVEAVLDSSDTAEMVASRFAFAARHRASWVGDATVYWNDHAKRLLASIKGLVGK
jgi:hypothetical protein